MELSTIKSKIYEVRGNRVILDKDLAILYQVETRVLNQTVKRNIKRFPEDFMFQLSEEEYNNLKSQFVTSSWGGDRKLPYAFTEQGVAMLSGLLNSDVAINANIAIMRAFAAMRNYLAANSIISVELSEIKTKLKLLEKNNEENMEAINDLSEDMQKELDDIYQAIAALSVKYSASNIKSKRPIGFKRQSEQR